MYSGRRSSVQRHINNINIHNGNATAIPFVEYLVGRKNGWYPPARRPSFGRDLRTPEEKIEEEAKNLYARRVAESSLPPTGDPSYLLAAVKTINSIKNHERMSDWVEAFTILGDMNRMSPIKKTQGTNSMDLEQHGLLHGDFDLEESKKLIELIQMNMKSNVEKAQGNPIKRGEEQEANNSPS